MEQKDTLARLPIGIQNFHEIRTENYAYVDKTGMAVELISEYKYTFLSRPRRFGKSLFLDTLHQLFAGEKELFSGLIAEDEYNWSESFPVIKISFGGGDFSSMERTKSRLLKRLRDNEKNLQISCMETEPDLLFEEMIEKAAQQYQQKVVILIDEYDRPILDNIDNPQLVKEIRALLKGLYSVMKDCDQYIRFAFLTGVSKFAEVSIFSGLNNIEDITLSSRFAAICGYTEYDLQTVFGRHLQGADYEKVKHWYNGYNFLGENVYNPFDILQFLRNEKRFENYWFKTGTPTFLIKLLQEKRFFLPSLSKIKIGDELRHSFDIDNIKPAVLLFQSGYLTIKETLSIGDTVQYILDFPNLEVRTAFNLYLLNSFTGGVETTPLQTDVYLALQENNIERLHKHLHTLFASIPYHNYTKNNLACSEGFYASVIYTLFFSLHFDMRVEDTTNKGRIDMTVITERYIYIIEFKVDTAGNTIADKALEQIKEKEYGEKYKGRNKEVIAIGISFSGKEKNITGWKAERLCSKGGGL